MTDKTTEALKLAEEALETAFNLLCSPVDSIAEMYCFGMGDCDEARQETKEALAAIRDALAEQSLGEYHGKLMREVCNKVITETLAAPEQEPVAWRIGNEICAREDWACVIPHGSFVGKGRAIPDSWVPLLYAAPVSAKREWVELTDDEILAIAIQYDAEEGISDVEYGNRVIAAFKEKNK